MVHWVIAGDSNMPDSNVFVVGKDVAGKLQVAAVKTNKRAMAYLELAFDNMRLLIDHQGEV